MTRRALYFILMLLAALLVALSTGAQVYYLLTLSMAMMLLLSVGSALLAILTVRVKIKCPRRSVERGAQVPVIATVSHMSVLPVRSVSLKLSVPDDSEANSALALTALPFQTHRYDLTVVCPHRGLYDIGVERVRASDVFGLFHFSKKIENCQFQIEVIPCTKQVPALKLRSGDTGDNRIVRMTEDNASPSDVRLWRSGDALKKVHWKLSMRKRELMVRTYEESARPDTLVLLDLSSPGSLKSHALTIEDSVCESAGSIVRAQLAAGYPVRMPLLNAQPTEVAGDNEAVFPRFLQALTQVKFDSPYSFEKVLMLEMRRMQRTGGAVLITPRLNARMADVSVQMARSGLSVCVVWITDNRRDDALEMVSRLSLAGVKALRVDPWSAGLTAEQMTKQVQL